MSACGPGPGQVFSTEVSEMQTLHFAEGCWWERAMSDQLSALLLRGREQLPGDLNPLNQANKACTQPPAGGTDQPPATPSTAWGLQVVHPTQMDELS